MSLNPLDVFLDISKSFLKMSLDPFRRFYNTKSLYFFYIVRRVFPNEYKIVLSSSKNLSDHIRFLKFKKNLENALAKSDKKNFFLN